MIKAASKKYVKPCPRCRKGYPIVQAIKDDKVLKLVCTHCGITGKVPVGEQ